MVEITEKDLLDVFTCLLTRQRDELIALSKEQLIATKWYYRHDPKLPKYVQFYEFMECLELYKKSCRDWETHHNGHVCVVERVRDEYLIPKIKEFIELAGLES